MHLHGCLLCVTEEDMKGYEIVEDGIGSKLMLEANWIKEMMWLVDCHSWMEVALSLWLINVKTEIDLTLGSARFIDTIVWGQILQLPNKMTWPLKH